MIHNIAKIFTCIAYLYISINTINYIYSKRINNNLLITSQNYSFNNISDTMDFANNVRLELDTLIVKSDNLKYFSKTNTAKIFNNISIIDKSNNIHINGSNAYLDMSKKTVTIQDKTTIKLPSNNINIHSKKTIISLAKGLTLHTIGGVTLNYLDENEDITIQGYDMLYHKDKNELTFNQDVNLQSSEMAISSDKLLISFKNNNTINFITTSKNSSIRFKKYIIKSNKAVYYPDNETRLICNDNVSIKELVNINLSPLSPFNIKRLFKSDTFVLMKNKSILLKNNSSILEFFIKKNTKTNRSDIYSRKSYAKNIYIDSNSEIRYQNNCKIYTPEFSILSDNISYKIDLNIILVESKNSLIYKHNDNKIEYKISANKFLIYLKNKKVEGRGDVKVYSHNGVVKTGIINIIVDESNNNKSTLYLSKNILYQGIKDDFKFKADEATIKDIKAETQIKLFSNKMSYLKKSDIIAEAINISLRIVKNTNKTYIKLENSAHIINNKDIKSDIYGDTIRIQTQISSNDNNTFHLIGEGNCKFKKSNFTLYSSKINYRKILHLKKYREIAFLNDHVYLKTYNKDYYNNLQSVHSDSMTYDTLDNIVNKDKEITKIKINNNIRLELNDYVIKCNNGNIYTPKNENDTENLSYIELEEKCNIISRHDFFIIKSEKILYNNKRIIIKDKAYINNNNFNSTSNEAYINFNKKEGYDIITLLDKVVVENKDSKLHSQYIEVAKKINSNQYILTSTKDTQYRNFENDILVYSDYLQFDYSSSVVYFKNNINFINARNSILISSQYMEYSNNNKKLTALNKVKVKGYTQEVGSNYLLYNLNTNKLVLSGDQTYIYDSLNKYYVNKIVIDTKKKDIIIDKLKSK